MVRAPTSEPQAGVAPNSASQSRTDARSIRWVMSIERADRVTPASHGHDDQRVPPEVRVFADLVATSGLPEQGLIVQVVMLTVCLSLRRRHRRDFCPPWRGALRHGRCLRRGGPRFGEVIGELVASAPETGPLKRLAALDRLTSSPQTACDGERPRAGGPTQGRSRLWNPVPISQRWLPPWMRASAASPRYQFRERACRESGTGRCGR